MVATGIRVLRTQGTPPSPAVSDEFRITGITRFDLVGEASGVLTTAAADLRGEPWLSEQTLSRPRVRQPRPPVWWGMTMATLFAIAGEVVSLRAAAAASCCPQQILPLIPSSSMRSPPLIDFGDPTNSGGTPCVPSALPAPHQLSRLERLMQPRSVPPILHLSLIHI